jgi:hypothetical protein
VLKDAGIAISMDARVGQTTSSTPVAVADIQGIYLREMTDGLQPGVHQPMGQIYNTERSHSGLAGRTPAEACWADRPVDMMDKARALPTSPQAQQQQKVININGKLLA